MTTAPTPPSWVTHRRDRWELAIVVQPGARRTEIVGRHGDALKIRVAAPPEAGRANQALVGLLSERLGVPRGAVELVRGTTARRKVVAVPATVLVAELHALVPG